MDSLLDIYTRIKLRIDNEIIVTYYRFGKKYTEIFTLLNIWEFSYILVSNKDNELSYITFFGNDTIIESIKVNGSNLPLYYNPYISEEIFDGYFIESDCLDNMKENILGNCEIDFESREYLIEKYIARDSVIKYDDLFFSDKQKEEFKLFFDMLVKELSEYAKKNGLDNELNFICSGTTSLIYEIGDKIIKIGKSRRKNIIPYCEYLLQPIINRDFNFDGYPLHIEVTQKVLVLENKDGCAIHSDDERFNDIVSELSKILYSMGLSTRDLHPGNVGILLDDNKIHYDDIYFDVGCEAATSIESNNNLRMLKKGRFVIIDLDCLVIEDIERYSNYLSFIGYDEDKISKITSSSKCRLREK